MTTPEMKDIDMDDAVAELREWIDNCDYDELAKLYSERVGDADVAYRVMEIGHCASDSSNWYMAGKCMQVQLVPVEGGE